MERKFNKAVTFSYDDGVLSDEKLASIFNRYGMKCSFNLNSGLYPTEPFIYDNHFTVYRHKSAVQPFYRGHEICMHGTKHLNPVGLSDAELDIEFRDDKTALERAFGTEIIGGAYAYGAYDDHAVEYLRNLGIRYCRTVEASRSLQVTGDLLKLKPTCHHKEEALFDLIDEFLKTEADTPQILYIWGHAYEFDGDENWERIEKACSLLAGKPDVLYGTNTEVFRYFGLI